MKKRFIRTDDLLADNDEVVIRGGPLDTKLIRTDAQRMHDIYGVFGVSVFAPRQATIDELAQQSPLARFAQLTIVSVQAIKSAGLSLEPTGRNPHHFTIMFQDLDHSVEALRSCRQSVWINPYYEA